MMHLSNYQETNPTSKFSSYISFDVPSSLGGGQVWWRKRTIEPKSLLLFSEKVLIKLPEILHSYRNVESSAETTSCTPTISTTVDVPGEENINHGEESEKTNLAANPSNGIYTI